MLQRNTRLFVSSYRQNLIKCCESILGRHAERNVLEPIATLAKVSTSLGFNFIVSESLLALPPGLPLEFLQLEKLLMSYRSVHVVIDERARAQIC